MVDDNSAFVLLPSFMHVRALLASASSTDPASDAGSEVIVDDVDGGGGGNNMLGVPGVDHRMRPIQVPSAVADSSPGHSAVNAAEEGVWADLPEHLSTLLPRPVRISDFRWESYADYLERRRDVYCGGA